MRLVEYNLACTRRSSRPAGALLWAREHECPWAEWTCVYIFEEPTPTRLVTSQHPLRPHNVPSQRRQPPLHHPPPLATRNLATREPSYAGLSAWLVVGRRPNICYA